MCVRVRAIVCVLVHCVYMRVFVRTYVHTCALCAFVRQRVRVIQCMCVCGFVRVRVKFSADEDDLIVQPKPGAWSVTSVLYSVPGSDW